MRSGCAKEMKMIKSQLLALFISLLVLASGLPTRENENSKNPVHIIQPPVRCPEGMKPDANGKCRKVWERSLSNACVDGEELDDNGICRKLENRNKIFDNNCSVDCLPEFQTTCSEDGNESCIKIEKLNKRNVLDDDSEGVSKVTKSGKKLQQFEAPKNSERRSKKKFEENIGNKKSIKATKDVRSKHFLLLLKKKKMQMMKPKPSPPPAHSPPPESEPEEQPEEEEQPGFERLFFSGHAFTERKNLSQPLQQDAEMVENIKLNKDFKEWNPPKSLESSESSDSSSSSDAEGESESKSELGSQESEDKILERAIKIKLMKIFRMKQRYGPALRRWLVDRLNEYEDSD